MTDGLKFDVSIQSNIAGIAQRDASVLTKMASALSSAKSQLGFFNAQLAHAKALGDISGKSRYESLARAARDKVFSLGSTLDSTGGRAPEGGSTASKVVGEHLGAVHQPIEIARHAINELGRGFREFGRSIGQGEFGGAVRGATEALGGLVSTLDLVVPGLGQAARAAVKVGGAFVEMGVQIVQSSVETALEVSAVNNQLRATFDALGTQGPQSGEKTLTMLNSLAAQLPQSREELSKYAKDFEALGFTDLGQLRYQIKATASAQAIMGNEGAEAYEHLSRKIRLAVEAHQGLKLGERPLEAIYKMGSNATDVAGRLGLTVLQLKKRLEAGTIDAQKFGNALSESLIAKGKGPIDALNSSWDVLKEKGAETWRHLFDGVDTKPLTDAIKMVIDLGNQGEPSGRALKSGITSGLNGIIKAIGEAIIVTEVFFLKMEARVIRAEIKLKPLVNIFKAIGLAASAAFDFLEGADAPGATRRTKRQQAHDNERAGGSWKFVTDGIKNNKQFGHNVFVPNAKAIEPPKNDASKFLDFAPEAPKVGSYGHIKGGRALGGSSVEKVDNSQHVHVGNVNVTAPEGVTDAEKMSVASLGTALERVQLMGAR